MNSNWQPYEAGTSVGDIGSEGGVILLDEWHPADARVTLERDGRIAPFSITYGLAGWFFHTVFFLAEGEAKETFESMKADLDAITPLVPTKNFTEEQMKPVVDAIHRFVERYP